MMQSLATVIATSPGAITVSCQQQTSCNACAAKSNCATGKINQMLPGRQHQLIIHTDEAVHVGDTVEIGLSERSVIHSALLVYLLPLLCLLLGASLAQWWLADTAGELAVIISALAAGGVGFAGARYFSRRIEGDKAYQPHLIRVLGASIATNNPINAASKDSD